MSRFLLAVLLLTGLHGPSLSLAQDKPPLLQPDNLTESPEAAFSAALPQAIGAPGRVDLAGQATVRLSGDLVFMPAEPGGRVMRAFDRPTPRGFLGLLSGGGGLDYFGPVRFVPAGFTDADAMLAFSPDDVLASLRETVEHGNAARVAQGLDPLEARGWVQPPRYDPETHRLVWAALILPKVAPADSGGEVIYNAIAFGADGYIQLSVGASVELAPQAKAMTADFIGAVNFNPGKGYRDAVAGTAPAQNGLAAAMGLDSLRRAGTIGSPLFYDVLIPSIGGLVALIGAASLGFYVLRHMRREGRRW